MEIDLTKIVMLPGSENLKTSILKGKGINAISASNGKPKVVGKAR